MAVTGMWQFPIVICRISLSKEHWLYGKDRDMINLLSLSREPLAKRKRYRFSRLAHMILSGKTILPDWFLLLNGKCGTRQAGMPARKLKSRYSKAKDVV